MIAALLLAEHSIAAERDVTLTVTADSRLDLPAGPAAQNVMTILGNLIDNALDALADQPAPREVSLTITDRSGIVIVVADTGPGVPAEHLTDIFADGFSTKPVSGDRRRGIGLALVRRVVNRAGGAITVTPGPGGRFEVTLPAVKVPA